MAHVTGGAFVPTVCIMYHAVYHQILRSELASFGAFFLLGFIPVGVVLQWLAWTLVRTLDIFHLAYLSVSPDHYIVIKKCFDQVMGPCWHERP